MYSTVIIRILNSLVGLAVNVTHRCKMQQKQNNSKYYRRIVLRRLYYDIITRGESSLIRLRGPCFCTNAPPEYGKDYGMKLYEAPIKAYVTA